MTVLLSVLQNKTLNILRLWFEFTVGSQERMDSVLENLLFFSAVKGMDMADNREINEPNSLKIWNSGIDWIGRKMGFVDYI